MLVLVGALAAAFSGAADAARPAGSYPETVTTPHFAVHFTGAFGNAERVTFQTAGDLAALAERAYDTFVTSWGYPAPLNDGDGKTDIWVQDLSASKILGRASADAAGNTSTAWLAIDVTAAKSQAVIAHEVLHAIQYGLWIPADSWLLEGSAEWAGFAASNYSPFGGVSLSATLAAPDMSLDCTSAACGNDLYETSGYSRWGFFQYLSERYGNLFFKDVLARGATLADPLATGSTLLAGTLAAKGTSLTSVAGAGAAIGATSVPVANSAGFAVGDAISIGNVGNIDAATVTSVGSGTIGVGASLKLSHGAGEPVVRTNGNIQYRDVELAQDACAAGRVLRFGKESEPTLTAGGEAFASGLSPQGKLESADEQPAFYGSPLVAWTPALGAETYAVQWSKRRRPFVPETDPATTALGMMTLSTSAVLPLEPGTWYYRVRGYDYSLPQNAQAMSWSEPQKIVATRPTFAVVGTSAGDKSTSKIRTLSATSAGFSIKVPSSFRKSARATASAAAAFRPLGARGSKLRLTAFESGRAALFVQTAPDRAALSQDAWARRAAATAKLAGASSCARISLPAGTGVRCTAVRGGQAAVLYLLQHRSTTYALTFAGRPSRRAADTVRFAAAARSLRFTR